MRLVAIVVSMLVLLAGCTGDSGSGDDGDENAVPDGPGQDTGTPVENETQRDPLTTPSTATCDVSYTGTKTGNTDLRTGEAETECDLLLNALEGEPLPFQVAYVEMRWDDAEPSINSVGVDIAFTENGTEIGSASQSTSPDGAGTLAFEVTLGASAGGSLPASLELIFEGSTTGWSATVMVSAFETSTIPSGYTAF